MTENRKKGGGEREEVEEGRENGEGEEKER